ncbi:J domain-containing protein [Pseudarthrobacter sp. NPDC058362]|uniref:J domain-containing protein n=1 Tax=unclassified Pseudarthrobacter TaxID=2647000 RepID=UPI0036520CF6
MTSDPDHYAVLGVRRDAGAQEISRAYRALMRSHHPDMDHGPVPEDELLRIMQAFNVLRDPQRRAAYDRQLAAPEGTAIPVRKAQPRPDAGSSGPVLRVTPVRWESGPWS